MRRLQIVAILIAPVVLLTYGSSAAQAAAPSAPSGEQVGAILGALMLGGLMGLFGQGVRTVVGFRTALDAASINGPTQDDVFRAARIVVSLFIGFLAGIAATFVVGLRQVANLGMDDIRPLLGIAATGYAGTDFIEGFFAQYFKGVSPPPIPSSTEAQPASAVSPTSMTTANSPDTKTQLNEISQTVSDLHALFLSSPSGGGAGSPQDVFRAKAPSVMDNLMSDFGFSDFQAAGVLGNIGVECLGFTQLQELNPIGGGRGGYGWCQWTGPRRRLFEAYCASNNLAVDSDEANYGFLAIELKTTYKSTCNAVKAAATLEDAVLAFLTNYEKPAVAVAGRRIAWAKVALAAHQDPNGN